MNVCEHVLRPCQAGQRRAHALLNGVATKVGADGALFHHRQRRGQGTGAQQCGKVGRLGDGECAADLARAADDRLVDHRRAEHTAIEHDGELAADVVAGDLGELARDLGIEPEGDDRLTGDRKSTRLNSSHT